MKLKKEEAVLVVIDFQEKLMPKMHDKEDLSKKAAMLIEGCKIIGLPTLVTQQYTKGIGDTVEEIKAALGEFEPIEKTAFSAWNEPLFVKALKDTKKKMVIICGIECHVCVQQTALDLLEEGYSVFLASDCVSSRDAYDKKQARKRMISAGCIGTTAEAILFELLGDSKAQKFKEISALVK